MNKPRWPVGALFSWTAGRPCFSVLVRTTNRLVYYASRTYSLTTFADNTPARLPGIGDLLKISQGC